MLLCVTAGIDMFPFPLQVDDVARKAREARIAAAQRPAATPQPKRVKPLVLDSAAKRRITELEAEHREAAAAEAKQERQLASRKDAADLLRRQRFLAAVPLFESVKEKDLKTLAVSMEEAEYEQGQPIITQGERGDTFFVLESGSAVARLEAAGGFAPRKLKQYAQLRLCCCFYCGCC